MLSPDLAKKIKSDVQSQVDSALGFSTEVYLGDCYLVGDEAWLFAVLSPGDATISVHFMVSIDRENLGPTHESWFDGDGSEFEWSDWAYVNLVKIDIDFKSLRDTVSIDSLYKEWTEDWEDEWEQLAGCRQEQLETLLANCEALLDEHKDAIALSCIPKKAALLGTSNDVRPKTESGAEWSAEIEILSDVPAVRILFARPVEADLAAALTKAAKQMYCHLEIYEQPNPSVAIVWAMRFSFFHDITKIYTHFQMLLSTMHGYHNVQVVARRKDDYDNMTNTTSQKK